jgi:hypothetical protein
MGKGRSGYGAEGLRRGVWRNAANEDTHPRAGRCPGGRQAIAGPATLRGEDARPGEVTRAGTGTGSARARADDPDDLSDYGSGCYGSII